MNKISEELNPHHDLSRAKRAIPECLQQIPARARRCSFCTSAVSPILDEDSAQLTDEAPGEIPLRAALPELKMPEPVVAIGVKPLAGAAGAEA